MKPGIGIRPRVAVLSLKRPLHVVEILADLAEVLGAVRSLCEDQRGLKFQRLDDLVYLAEILNTERNDAGALSRQDLHQLLGQ